MFCMHVACFVGGDWWLLGSVQAASRQLPCGNSLAACFSCSAGSAGWLLASGQLVGGQLHVLHAFCLLCGRRLVAARQQAGS